MFIKIRKFKFGKAAIIGLLTVPFFAAAEEDADGKPYQPVTGNGGYFEVTLGGSAYDGYLRGTGRGKGVGLGLRLGYRWNGFFIESGKFGSRGNGIGYNFYQSDEWEFDAILHVPHGEIRDDYNDELRNGIEDRKFDRRLALRGTRYYNDSIFRFIVSPLSTRLDDDGIYAAGWFGKSWQIKNWNLHGIAGVQYYSSDILNHFYGIPESEENERFQSYNAGGGVIIGGEIGASYALSESWVFEASVNHAQLPGAISDSPITESGSVSSASINFVYVF